MDMTKPIISVVMPVYNGEKYLREAIDSILNQTYNNFEFIILNDGSTDKTEEIILSYDDTRIVYVKNEENLQIVKTLNKGVSLAKGKYIARMDADDISQPDRFKKQIQFMEHNPDVGVCGTWVKTFGDTVTNWAYPTESSELYVSLLFYTPIAHPSVIIRKVIFNKFMYEQSYNKAEDYKLWVDISKKYKIVNIPFFLLRYRLHSSQTGAVNNQYQLNITNKIRKEVLSDFGLIYEEQEFNTHVAISHYQIIDLFEAEKWLVKIITHNKRVNYFSHEFLIKIITRHWFYIVNQHTDKGLGIFIHYLFRSSLPIKKSLISSVKLFVKCFTQYNPSSNIS